MLSVRTNICYHNHNKYIVTHGFTKKTQKTSSREIQRAKVTKKEYEEEQYANNKI